GSAKDGRVAALIPDPEPLKEGTGPGTGSAAEGVAADADGNGYGPEGDAAKLRESVKKCRRAVLGPSAPAGLNITRLRRRRACCLNRRQGAADLSRLVWAHLRGAQSVRELPKIHCCLRTCHAEARVLPQLRSSLTRG